MRKKDKTIDWVKIRSDNITTVQYIAEKCSKNLAVTLREKCPNTEFSWYVFSCIWTEYGDLLHISSRNSGNYKPEKTSYLDTFYIGPVIYCPPPIRPTFSKRCLVFARFLKTKKCKHYALLQFRDERMGGVSCKWEPRLRSYTSWISKMELFVIMVNSFQPLAIVTKTSILDFLGIINPLLIFPKFVLIAFLRLR